ncbi:MAG: hypothetical protein J7L88_04695, partial [Thermoplasmata archaeon]|nr:hypothetical protein [Thermoplasmata archaeon]
YIRYSSEGSQKDFKIDWTEELKSIMIKIVKEIREADEGKREVHRNHRRPGKCRHCSRREVCPERLD